MQATIISDNSRLVLLDKIGALNLLQRLFGEVIITQTVAEEFGKHLPDWVRVQNPTNVTNRLVPETALDEAEAFFVL